MVLKTRVGETKILGKDILPIPNCSYMLFEVSSSFVFKTDPRNTNYSVVRMLVGVPAAVLHVVLKTRVGETKIIGNGILTFYIYHITNPRMCFEIGRLRFAKGRRYHVSAQLVEAEALRSYHYAGLRLNSPLMA